MLDTDMVELKFGWVDGLDTTEDDPDYAIEFFLGEDVEICTWKDFVNVNADGFGSNLEEVQEIAKVLDSGNIYRFNVQRFLTEEPTGFHWDEEQGMLTGRVSQPKKLDDFYPNYISLQKKIVPAVSREFIASVAVAMDFLEATVNALTNLMEVEGHEPGTYDDELMQESAALAWREANDVLDQVKNWKKGKVN